MLFEFCGEIQILEELWADACAECLSFWQRHETLPEFVVRRIFRRRFLKRVIKCVQSSDIEIFRMRLARVLARYNPARMYEDVCCGHDARAIRQSDLASSRQNRIWDGIFFRIETERMFDA